MSKQSIRYVVKFSGQNKYGSITEGYYTDTQLRYEWAFDEDIYKAKMWKSEIGAMGLIRLASTCNYRTCVTKIIPISFTEERKIINLKDGKENSSISSSEKDIR